MTTQRQGWDPYFMTIAHAVATRATCDRKHVGCVLVVNRRIVATGYNGSIPGLPHCDDVGHDILNDHCVRTIHAEVNAIAQAARHGIAIDGATAYTNTFPCWPCFRALAGAGVKTVCFDGAYRVDPRVEEAAIKTGIRIVEVSANRPAGDVR